MPEETIVTTNETAGAAAASEPAGTTGAENEKTADVPEKKYSDEDLDRILAGKIARERRKLTDSINSQLAAELNEREQNILKRELRADAKDKLTTDGLPTALADCISYESKEAFDNSYSSVVKAFKEALIAGMNDRMRGVTPRACQSNFSVDRVRDAFARKE